MVAGLLDVPAVADPEGEAAAGEVVQRRDLLGEVDRVVLGDQRDARAEAEPLGDRGGLAERDEGVERAAVLGRQVRRPPGTGWSGSTGMWVCSGR